MSSLDKLGIRGIRSFDNNELNVIQFFHPLTVIVGHNGSGKTTIIECLKYITTGDMPPNTKGGAFVHDPNMAGETEVKAEVKLRFINTNGDRMTADRRLQVTKKKTNLSLKTLEGTIAYTNNEDDKTKRRSLSTRCSDLDDEIPRLLGVSKSILENVIFCHQEESNWPLSEPGVLKKKFDDIFEATKYTKALDQIKSIKKDQTTENKTDKARLDALKTDRERAIKVQNTIQKLERDYVSKSAESEQLDEQVKHVTAHNKQFYEMVIEHGRIVSEVENLNTHIQATQKSIDGLRNSITELPGTRAQLEQQRDSFAREAEGKVAKKQGYKRDMDAVEDERFEVGKKLGRAQTEKGTLQAEMENFNRALDDRQSTVTSLASQHDIRGFDINPLEEAQIEEFERRLSEEMQKKKRTLDGVRETARSSEDEKRGSIGTVESEQKSHQTVRKGIREQQDRATLRIDELSLQIDNARSADSDVLSYQQTIQEAQTKQAGVQEELRNLDLDSKIKARNREVKTLEDTRDGLHQELSTLNRQADTRARLAIARSEASKKEEQIQNMMQLNADRYKQHIGQDIDKERMLEHVRSSISASNGELVRAEKAALSAQRELNQVESNVTLLKQQKTTSEKELADAEAKVTAETEGQPLEDAIKDAEEEIRVRHSTIEQLGAAKAFYSRVLEHGRKKDTCIACNRGLSEAELPAFEAYCRKQMQSNPQQIKESEDELQEWQAVLAGLRKVEPLAATAKKLRETEIPRYQTELDRVTGRHTNAIAKAEEASNKVVELKSTVRELESLKLVASDISKLSNDAGDASREAKRLERELETTGSARTADDVQGDLRKVANELSEVKQSIEADQRRQSDLDRRLRACEQDISRTQVKLSAAQAKVEARTVAQRQKGDAEAEKASLQERLEAADRQIKESEPALQRLRRELRDLMEKNAEKETDARNDYDALSKGYDQLARAMTAVKRFKKNDTKARLRSCEATIKQLDTECKNIEERMRELQKEISQIEKDENNAKALERNVNDNIRYRQLKEEIKDYQAKIDEKDLEGANRAKRQYDKEYDASRRKLVELQAQHARVSGEVAMLESNLEERRSEIESEYKDIEKSYKCQLIKVKTAEFAIQDLEKYGKALDKAIMAYHSHKMMEINDTAQTLWNKCYQGTDIDTIMIRSDSDGPVKVGNRSYNYRVVMVKDQVEMDMRGRCSAGQKVLASIIIRLALAESFGTNCGILALDEPTTNLDKDNIAALATALADIIKERRQQSNFQLIVITHDEEFLSSLGASGALEKYWRVSRNHRQKSTIERQRLDQH